VSIILCDIDHFKKINDQHGHNAGDAVLKGLAKIFLSSVREQDCVARWGGEEFVFILPNTTAQNANVIAKNIQNKLQHTPIIIAGTSIFVTLSMGIEELKVEQSIDEAINSADNYLYQAKDAGRNQIFPQL